MVKSTEHGLETMLVVSAVISFWILLKSGENFMLYELSKSFTTTLLSTPTLDTNTLVTSVLVSVGLELLSHDAPNIANGSIELSRLL